MISVIVSYQVSPEFAEQNKENIRAFLADFEQLDQSRFQYNVFLKEDGVSFIHQAHYQDEAIQTHLLQVPSFKAFQELRDASGLNDSHRLEIVEWIGSKGKLNKTGSSPLEA